MKTKRWIAALLCFLLIGSMIPVSAFADDIASGTGWNLDADGVLHITGDISESGFDLSADQKLKVKSVVAESGASISSGGALFDGFENMTSADLRLLNTTGVRDMSSMFMSCNSLTSLDVSGFDTSSVTDMNYMFYGCSSLTSLDLSGFDTSSVTTMGHMFENCSSLTSLDVSGFKTDRLLYAKEMFRGCSALTSLGIRSDILYKNADCIIAIRSPWQKKGSTDTYSTADELKAVTDTVTLLAMYTVNVQNDGNGTASANPAAAVNGDTVTLTATPNNGCHFKEWQSSDVTINGNSFTMPEKNVTVKAIFEADAPTTYNLWVDGDTQVTSANKDDVLGDGTVSFDPATNTLTLSGYDGSRIKANMTLNIVLADGTENTVSILEDFCGIYTYGNCTLSGKGNLDIHSTGDGIYASNGNLTVNISGDLSVSSDSSGLSSNGYITISGSGNVVIDSKKYGLWPDKDVTISDSSKLTVTAAQYAVYIDDSRYALLLNGTGTPISLTAGSGYKAVLNDAGESPVGGTNLANYTVTGAPDTASVVYTLKSGAPATEYDLWVSGVQVTEVNKGNVLGDSGTPTVTYDPATETLTLNDYDGSYIKANCPLNIVLADGTTNAISVPSNIDENGIYANGGCTISGSGSLTVEVYNLQRDAIRTIGDLTISGAVDLRVDRSYNCGISTQGDVSVSGNCSLTFLTGSSSIAVFGDLSISGSVVADFHSSWKCITCYSVSVDLSDSGSMTLKSEIGGDGINVQNDVVIGGSGEVTINADGRGIYSNSGNVIFSGNGVITVTSVSDAVAIYDPTGEKALLLNGTAAPITLIAGDSHMAVAGYHNKTSPVGGTSLLTYYDDITGAPNESKVIYDHVPSYGVSFELNGHGDQITARTVRKGDKAAKPADPEASGYAFDGWYADAAFSARFDFDTAITANTTIYAKWTEITVPQPPVPTTYTVSFNMNGHGTQVTEQTVEEGCKAIKPADPTASGWTFGGWYADAAFSTKFDFDTAITANTTAYAKWTKNSAAPADPTNPQTGDNSNMFLWIALLLVSGGALVGTTVYSRKKKYNTSI